MKVGIINCGADKKSYKCKAKDLYIGNLFIASRKFVESNYTTYCILSAKYHCVNPNDILEPYDMFLGNFTKEEKQHWGEITAHQLLSNFPKDTEFDFYVSQSYLDYILPILESNNVKYNCYLNHMGLGYKIQWFNQHTKKAVKKLF